MNHILEHTRIWWCGWDLPALIILAAVITFCLYRVYQQKKIRAALKQRIEEIRENNSRLAAES